MKYIKIKKKDFYRAYKTIEKTYNMLYLVLFFCKNNKITSEFENILPALEFLHNESDILYSEFIRYEKKLKNKYFPKTTDFSSTNTKIRIL